MSSSSTQADADVSSVVKVTKPRDRFYLSFSGNRLSPPLTYRDLRVALACSIESTPLPIPEDPGSTFPNGVATPHHPLSAHSGICAARG